MNEGDLPAEAFVTSPVPTVQFYIPATSSLQERRPRTLKHGDTFGVFDHYGDIAPGESSPEGLFHDDTRFLSSLQLLVNDRRPLLLSSTVQDNNALLIADLTNPDFFADGRLDLPRDTIHIVRAKFIWEGVRSRAARGAQFRRSDASRPPDLRVPERLRRSVRGARPSPTPARQDRGRTSRPPRRGVQLSGPRRAAPPGPTSSSRRSQIRSRPSRPRTISSLEPGQRISLFVTVKCDGKVERQPRPEQFFRLPARRQAGLAPLVVTRRLGRHLERDLQRGDCAAQSPTSTCC